MKLLVISDTHGRVDSAVKIGKTIKNLDHVIHLGDIAADARRISDRLGIQVISVNGNCDQDFSDDNYRILEAECGNILLLHGHRESVKSGLTRLFYRTLELDCIGAFFGHSHRAVIVESDGITLLNPGSMTYTGPGEYPSYAVAETDAKGISASIVYITKPMGRDKLF